MTRRVTSLTTLSPQQAEVARLMAEGLSNKEIGKRMGLSGHTIGGYASVIYGKLGIESRLQLAVWVTKGGLDDTVSRHIK